jgi:leucyl-tRNA synthetase
LAQLIAPFRAVLAPIPAANWQAVKAAYTPPLPHSDPALLAVQQVSIPVQVNGKLRGVIEVEPDAEEALVVEMAMKLEGVIRAWVTGSRKRLYMCRAHT